MVALIGPAPWRRRVPIVRQVEMADCGAACLSMVLGFYRHHISLSEARRECGVSRDGASAYSIAKAAQARGMTVTALHVAEASGLTDLPVPVIVHLRERHFVVLERVVRGTAHVVDPAIGRAQLPAKELRSSSTGLVLTFTPSAGFEPRARPKGGGLQPWASWRFAPATSLTLVATIAAEALGVLFPLASQVLIDVVIRPQQEAFLWILCAVFAVTALVRLALLALRDSVMHSVNHLLDLHHMTVFVDRLLHLPISFFHGRSTSDLLARATTELEIHGFSSRTVRAAVDGVVVLSYAALMLTYDAPLAMVVVGLSIARLLGAHAIQRRAGRAALAEQTARGREWNMRLEAFAATGLTSLPDVRDHLVDQHATRLEERLRAMMERRRILDGASPLDIVLTGSMYALLVGVGGGRLLANQISLGVFAAFLTMEALLTRPLAALLHAFLEWSRLRGLVVEADEVFDTPPEEPGRLDATSLPARIALQRVTFRYGRHGPNVLDRVSFEVAEGEKVAIIGRSGCGKSTLARIMVGWLRPTDGTVRIGGVDLRELSIEALRRRVGLVCQDTFFFRDTVRANLALASPDASFADIRRAAKLACIDDVIDTLPQGYETVLRQHRQGLSAGERQRLALARALLGSPAVLLLDEATSALDLETERRVHANLAALRCTRIIVTQRLETVRDADRVIVLDGATIVQDGRFDTLAVEGGVLNEMVGATGDQP